jgi:glucan phosphoethanolaminetransferase (alkaline phosphatase superfamily)
MDPTRPEPLPTPLDEWQNRIVYRGVIFWYLFVAGVLWWAPDRWFGPTWYYFSIIPHGGGGLSIACTALACLMMYAIRRKSRRLMRLSLALGGVAFWVASWLIFAEGMAGNTGVMEAFFMLYVSIDLFIKGLVRWHK